MSRPYVTFWHSLYPCFEIFGNNIAASWRFSVEALVLALKPIIDSTLPLQISWKLPSTEEVFQVWVQMQALWGWIERVWRMGKNFPVQSNWSKVQSAVNDGFRNQDKSLYDESVKKLL